MRHFVAINDLPASDDEVDSALQRLAALSRSEGLHPVETMLTDERAYTFWEADSAEHVQRVLEHAGLRVLEVMPGRLVYTDLLGEPNPARPT